ncbi:MAG: site-specific DNA-methyltransferase [Candidatus Thiodiazotropha sp. (ex Epidulcina cf. delphinae)]|nr:site-specific DNA-methyltransferase [Candidatus Thiodiazotropha sp. (ex Epidulcina cf. delphinae)]
MLVARLRYYNDKNIVPTGGDLDRVLRASSITEIDLMLRMGRLNRNVLEAIRDYAGEIRAIIKDHDAERTPYHPVMQVFETSLGKLYEGDCISLMREIESDTVDLVFADPPFNLNKLYPSKINDNLKTEHYINWCQEWLSECIRILKHGGSLFIWNLPKWNAALANFLEGRLNFLNWISVDIKYSLPIQGRLYPSHYSLLYYTKGERPRVFHPDRLPMQICPHCYGDLKDYGGYKDKMNPRGINLSDIWLDIPPVRHAKYKRRNGANELSLKLLDRIVELTTDEGDLVFDPFGGSGTTYMAAELKNRRWIGVEIGPTDDIVNRFDRIHQERGILNDYRESLNTLFTEDAHKKRVQVGLWTCESVRNKKKNGQASLFETEKR